MIIEIVTAIALAVGVPPELAIEMLRAESGLNPTAQHTNVNGTVDFGLGQLNSASLPSLLAKHWDYPPEEFDWQLPQHNALVALRHLKYLRGKSPDHNWWTALLLYNGGEWVLENGNIPANSSIEYANKIYTKVFQGKANQ